MNRREFSALLPVLLAGPSLAEAAQATAGSSLSPLKSGEFPPLGSGASSASGRTGHRFALGMLPDNIRLEAHTTTLAPGAGPEKVEHHKHSEIWFVRQGTLALMTNGETHELKAGEMGLCVAGNEHSVSNASKTEPCSYFVVAVGPPE